MLSMYASAGRFLKMGLALPPPAMVMAGSTRTQRGEKDGS